MKRNKISAFLLALALASGELFYGTAVPVFADSELFSDRDFETEYQEDECIPIVLNGNTAECNSDGVQISDGMITVTAEGTYLISGELTNGMIIIDTEKESKVRLILNGVSITSETSAPIYVKQADKVFITTVNDTENVLANGGSFTAIDDNNIDAAVFSKDDLTFNGSGTLKISSPAGHGIVSKDSLTFTGGVYDITCSSHALSGKDDISIADGEFTLTSGKDGIHGEAAPPAVRFSFPAVPCI